MHTPTEGKRGKQGKKTSPKKSDVPQEEKTEADPRPPSAAAGKSEAMAGASSNQEILDTLRTMSTTFTDVVSAVSTLNDRMQRLEEKVHGLEDTDQVQSQHSSSPDASAGAKHKQPSKLERRKPRYSTMGDLANFRPNPMQKEDEEDCKSESNAENATVPKNLAAEQIFKGKKPGKLFRDLKKSAEVANSRTVTITREEKRCPVRIESLKLGVVAKAINDILVFQEEEVLKGAYIRWLSLFSCSL